MVKRRTDGWERAPRAMVGRLLPSGNPVAEEVLEWDLRERELFALCFDGREQQLSFSECLFQLLVQVDLGKQLY